MDKLLFGKYVIKDKLGQGGMAIVYKAWDPALQREIAIKALLPKYKSNVDIVKMFIREGQLMAKMDDPHIVKVYENAKYNDFFFYVMEYVNGQTLQDIIRKGLSLEEAEVIFKEILKALLYIHKKDILHLDLKPSNILIEQSGKIKISDFGIGIQFNKENINNNLLVGTLKYIAPEQINGNTIGYHTDIYQLGVILYEMLTGEPPFTGTNEEIKSAKTQTEPPPLHSKNSFVPDYLSSVCARMLRKHPQDRYKNTEEVLDDLDRLKSEYIMPSYFKKPKAELYTEGVYGEPKATEQKKKRSKIKWGPLIASLAALTILVSIASIYKSEYLPAGFPFRTEALKTKFRIIERMTVFDYNEIMNFAKRLSYAGNISMAEDTLNIMMKKFPGSAFDINSALLDLYADKNENKYTALLYLMISKNTGEKLVRLYMRAGDYYSSKSDKKKADEFYRKAAENEPNEEIRALIIKKITE